jgi:hypothetical protein
MTPEQENEAVMKAAILDWVMAALAGEEVCDFAGSFVEVAAAQAARSCIQDIATMGCCRPGTFDSTPGDRARGTLALLGNAE